MNDKILDKVRTSMQALSIENAYKNLIYMSGWVIEKPHIIKHNKTGKESVSIVLTQFMRDSNGYAYMKTFYLVSYLPTIVKQFKEMKKVVFIICDCQMQFNSKCKIQYPQIYDMKVEYTLSIPLQERENKK